MTCLESSASLGSALLGFKPCVESASLGVCRLGSASLGFEPCVAYGAAVDLELEHLAEARGVVVAHLVRVKG